MQTSTVENIFVRAWQLLRRNPVIVVPGLVAGLIAGFVSGVAGSLSSSATGPVTAAAGVLAGLTALIIGIIAAIATIAYTTGMAGAAWQRGVTTLADGSASFAEDAGRVFGAMVVLIVVAVVLGIVSFGIGTAIFGFFAIYTLPAVVLANRGPIAALRESFRIAAQRWITTLLILLLLFFVGIIVVLLTIPFAIVPLLGQLIFAVVMQAVTAFATLVIVGEYLGARSSGTDAYPESRI